MKTFARRQQQRAAFTLVELLVVIAIIAILVSLLMAGVQRVRVLGPQTDNGARISQIAQSIGTCKNDLKLSYIPSQQVGTSPAPAGGGFLLKSQYNGNEAELDILLRAFPNMNTATNPDPSGNKSNGYTGGDVVLDSNQTLCLFLTGGLATNLTGFSNNPRQPFAPASNGQTRKGPWLEPNQKLFAAGGNGHPWLVDVYGVPFAYFASVDGKQNNYGTQSYSPASGAAGTAKPWSSTSGIMNQSGFQLLSAGRDKTFGGGGTLPAFGSPGGEDDQSNFSQYLLGGRLD